MSIAVDDAYKGGADIARLQVCKTRVLKYSGESGQLERVEEDLVVCEAAAREGVLPFLSQSLTATGWRGGRIYSFTIEKMMRRRRTS